MGLGMVPVEAGRVPLSRRAGRGSRLPLGTSGDKSHTGPACVTKPNTGSDTSSTLIIFAQESCHRWLSIIVSIRIKEDDYQLSITTKHRLEIDFDELFLHSTATLHF